MQAKREQWQYKNGEKVWVGRYRNSQNMPHWHYDCELLFVEKGSLNVFCAQSYYTVSAGDAFFIDSEQIHNMHALSPDTTLIAFIFSYDIIKPFAENLSLSSPVLSKDYGFAKLYQTLKRELIERGALYTHYTENLILKLMIDVFRHEKCEPKNALTAERLKPLLNEINEKYEFYTLNAAAEFMSMSTAYFSRLFHKLMGITFTQYLNYIKILNAVNLLHSDKDATVAEVSERCGFDTIRNFNRLFKIYTGYSPTNLPASFVIDKNSSAGSDNPTLTDCVLLESSDGYPL